MSVLFSISLSSSEAYSTALSNLNLLSDVEQSSSPSRRRRVAAETTTTTAAEQLDLITLTLEGSVLTTSSAQLLIDNTASLVTSDLSLEDQGGFISRNTNTFFSTYVLLYIG